MKIPAKTENPHITYERNNFRAKSNTYDFDEK